MNNYKYKEQSGRSMIEMLGVLAIIGVLSVGGIAGYSKAMNKFKTNQVADQVSMLIANIKTMYAQQNSYEGLNNKTAVDMGLVPDELNAGYNEYDTGKKDDGGNAIKGNRQDLTNSFNGNVYISAASSVGGESDNLAFYIIYTGLSKEACITLATNDWGSSFSSGLIGMQAKGGETANAQHTDADVDAITMGCEGGTNGIACAGKSMPMNVTAAANACACTKGNMCSIFWKYY